MLAAYECNMTQDGRVFVPDLTRPAGQFIPNGGGSAGQVCVDDDLEEVSYLPPLAPVHREVLIDFGLATAGHRGAFNRMVQHEYANGAPIVRETVNLFCEAMHNVTNRGCSIIAEKDDEIQQLKQELAHKNDEVETVSKERDAECTRANQMSERMDLFSVNEASLRNEMDKHDEEKKAKELENTLLVGRITALDRDIKEKDEKFKELAAELEAVKARNKELEEQQKTYIEAGKTAHQLLSDVAVLFQGGPFSDPITKVKIECPILCCSGAIMSAKSIIDTWASRDGSFDGSISRTFTCALTKIETSIAPRCYVDLVQIIAAAVHVKTQVPCVVEYHVSGEWVMFPVYDTMEIVARICKIYRRGSAGPADTLLLGGTLMVSFLLTDGMVIEDANGDVSSRKKLVLSVQTVGAGSQCYEGRFRLVDGDWNPFPLFEAWVVFVADE
jgi:hypothetical protein